MKWVDLSFYRVQLRVNGDISEEPVIYVAERGDGIMEALRAAQFARTSSGLWYRRFTMSQCGEILQTLVDLLPGARVADMDANQVLLGRRKAAPVRTEPEVMPPAEVVPEPPAAVPASLSSVAAEETASNDLQGPAVIADAAVDDAILAEPEPAPAAPVTETARMEPMPVPAVERRLPSPFADFRPERIVPVAAIADQLALDRRASRPARPAGSSRQRLREMAARLRGLTQKGQAAADIRELVGMLDGPELPDRSTLDVPGEADDPPVTAAVGDGLPGHGAGSEACGLESAAGAAAADAEAAEPEKDLVTLPAPDSEIVAVLDFHWLATTSAEDARVLSGLALPNRNYVVAKLYFANEQWVAEQAIGKSVEMTGAGSGPMQILAVFKGADGSGFGTNGDVLVLGVSETIRGAVLREGANEATAAA